MTSLLFCVLSISKFYFLLSFLLLNNLDKTLRLNPAFLSEGGRGFLWSFFKDFCYFEYGLITVAKFLTNEGFLFLIFIEPL